MRTYSGVVSHARVCLVFCSSYFVYIHFEAFPPQPTVERYYFASSSVNISPFFPFLVALPVCSGIYWSVSDFWVRERRSNSACCVTSGWAYR